MSDHTVCLIHHREKEPVDCWNCGGEGVDGHDCGDDCCVCADPEDNVRCHVCRGKGVLILCFKCAPDAFEN